MTVPCDGVCESWITEDDLCSPCMDLLDYTGSPLEDAMKMASDLLYYATAQQYPGACREIVQPCADGCSNTFSYSLYRSLCSCSDRPRCGCSEFREVDLGFYPLASINEIRVCNSSNPDWPGTCILDSSLYHIDEFSLLVRDANPDGSTPNWPSCGSMSKTNTADDLFQVDFNYGKNPPSFLKRAAAVLACEIYMGCDPESFEGQCRLPRNVVSIVRQGVSVVMESAFFTAQRGKPIQFGIPEIDYAIALANPNGLMAPSVILSPDDDPVARRVNT